MTMPPAGATARPAPEPTHPCVRCGVQVPQNVSLCERCNPLGLQQPATSQVHGTVFLALVVAIIVLAVAGRAALAGVGPFRGQIIEVLPAQAGLAVTLAVQNDGTKTGATTCRLTRTANRGTGASAIVQSPQIEPGQSRQFTTTTDKFGAESTVLSVECQSP